MQKSDDPFVAVMTATEREATDLGARSYGSEHVLLGLLASDDHLTQEIGRRFPALASSAVRAAVRGAADDAPHLARLGLTAADLAVAPRAESPVDGARPRNTRTPELQSALDVAKPKWVYLCRTGALPQKGRLGVAYLWLAVLEPSARASRLLEAMEIDPDAVRTAVLTALVPAGAAVPQWPTESPVESVARRVQGLFGRTNAAR